MNMTYFYLVLVCYLAVAFAKIMLSLPGIYLSARVLSRFSPVSENIVFHLLLILLVLPLTVILIWPRILKSEGWQFFVVPTDRQVIRQVLNGLE